MASVLVATQLSRHFRVRAGMFARARLLRAVDAVNLRLAAGATLAIVGESGCGKSTLARLLAMADTPTSGRLEIVGQQASPANWRSLRPLVQMVFQNPFASLNPRKTVATIVAEPLCINARMSRAQRNQRAAQMLEQVGLRTEDAGRFPHMFSGGQRQRIAIARAMILNPRIVVADEPTSALDVSIQAQILNLFADLQRRHGTSFVFVSHDLAVVRHIADEILVMYLGRVVEYGAAARVLGGARHPYTQALLSATPTMQRTPAGARIRLRGDLPSPLVLPSGCGFRSRCALADERCARATPPLTGGDGHVVACFKV